MSFTVICHGCGQKVVIDDDYRRNKIQCACGVICPIPEDRPRPQEPAAERPRPRKAAKAAPTAAPAPARSEPTSEPVYEESEPPKRSAPAEARVPCRRCGRLILRQRECPTCDVEETPDGPPALEAAAPQLEIDAADDEEGTPYRIEGGEERRCPRCHKVMDPDGVVCVACGFDQRRKKKVARVYQPIVRRWETDYTFRQRLAVFIALEALFVLVSMGASFSGAGVPTIVGSGLGLTVLASFLLGTFSRLDLIRDPRGRVYLTKTWRACFIPLTPKPIPLHGYEGLVTGRASEPGSWEKYILLILAPTVIPAFFWWYFTMHRVIHHVALAQDHGYPAVYLFQGWSEEQMREIVTTLGDVTGLRHNPGC